MDVDGYRKNDIRECTPHSGRVLLGLTYVRYIGKIAIMYDWRKIFEEYERER